MENLRQLQSLLTILLVSALWACSPAGIEPRTAGAAHPDQGRRSYLQGDYQATIKAFHRRLQQRCGARMARPRGCA